MAVKGQHRWNPLAWPPVRSATVSLAPLATAPSRGRRSVRDVLDWAPADAADRAELLVSELVTNSVVHAGLGAEEDVDLHIACGRGHVRVEVVDPGPPFEPDPVYEPDRSWHWGLHLVGQLADRWGVDRRAPGKAVWFEIDI